MRFCFLGVFAALAIIPGTGQAADVFVLPVVVTQAPGLNESIWETEVRVLGLNPGEDLIVRRKWVCLEGGGGEDDPATAPTWRLDDPSFPLPNIPLNNKRMILLTGATLLQGTGKKAGAVAIEVEGAAMVFSRIANGNGEDASSLDINKNRTILLGVGQLIPALEEPMNGPSLIPWTTSNVPIPVRGFLWRNNLGLANPNPEAITFNIEPVGLRVEPNVDICFEEDAWICPGIGYEHFEPNPILISLPPWGWVQENDVLSEFRVNYSIFDSVELQSITSGLVLNILPENPDQPYYAYLSQVFSGINSANDPAYIPAISGRFQSAYDN